MKEFSDLRTSLQESVENLEEHSGILQGAMPPNILILRRKSVRQFPDHTMVALYYNDKLDQYFSIPYGGDVEDTITPGSLKEESLNEGQHKVGDKVLAKLGGVEQQGKVTEIHPGYLIVHGAGEHHKISPNDITRNFRVDKSLGWGAHELEEEKKLNSSQRRVQQVAKKQRKEAEDEDFAQAQAEDRSSRRLSEDEQKKTSQEKEIERHERTAKMWKGRKQRWDLYKLSQGRDKDDPSVNATLTKRPLTEISVKAADSAYHERQRRGEEALGKKDYGAATAHFSKAMKTVDRRAKKYGREDAGELVKEDQLNEMPESSWKTRDIHHHLKKHGWTLIRASGGHDLYSHPNSPQRIAVPRHKQLKAPLIRGILHQVAAVHEEVESNEEPLNELHTKTLKSYISKAQHDVSSERKTPLSAKARKRYLGMGRALDQMHKVNEEEEKPKDNQEKEAEHPIKTVKSFGSIPTRPRGGAGSALQMHQRSRGHLNEDAISHLQRVKAFNTNSPLRHKDGTQTHIDPTTANALLTVHDALHPDNQKKFADALEHSKPKFHKMLDFTWKQVK